MRLILAPVRRRSASSRPQVGAPTIEPLNLHSIREAADLVGLRRQQMNGLMIGLGIKPRRVASALTVTADEVERMSNAVKEYQRDRPAPPRRRKPTEPATA